MSYIIIQDLGNGAEILARWFSNDIWKHIVTNIIADYRICQIVIVFSLFRFMVQDKVRQIKIK